MPLLLVLFFGGGFHHAGVHLLQPQQATHSYNLIREPTEATCIGTLQSMVTCDGRTTRLLLAVSHILIQGADTFIESEGLVLFFLRSPLECRPLPGQTLMIRAKLMRPGSYQSPGSFDYARYLARRTIWLTGFISANQLLTVIDTPRTMAQRIRYWPEKLRMQIGEKLDAALTDPQVLAVYRAILLGDRSRLDHDLEERFKGSGTMHILAISGLHIGIISLMLYWLVIRIFRFLPTTMLFLSARKGGALVTIPVLVLYGLITGMNPPVVRAVTMVCLVMAAICINRCHSPGTLIAAAALFLLIYNPLWLFTISFQLSFTAIWTLLILYPELTRQLFPASTTREHTCIQRIGHWGLAALLVSLTATIATTPLALAVFYRFSPVGILANLAVEPLVCLVSLPAGLIAVLISFVSSDLGTMIFHVGAVGLKTTLLLTDFFSSLPGATLWLPPPPLWLLVYCYCGLAILPFGKRNFPLIGSTVLIIGGLSLYQVALVVPSLVSKSADMEISFLDVGQGSASHVSFNNDVHILIDGGGSGIITPDVGVRVIGPYLWTRYIRRLDAIIVTHSDADHSNGLSFILEHFRPRLLWISRRKGTNPAYREMLELAAAKGVQTVIPQPGDRLEFNNGYVECISNLANPASTPTGSSRNAGLVVKTCTGDSCCLFPGDIEAGDELKLVATATGIEADFLLAAHHGSSSSNTRAFLERVAPRRIFVSAGPRNKHFPGKRLHDNSRALGVPVLTTGDNGTMHLAIDAERWEVQGYLRRSANPLAPMAYRLLDNQSFISRIPLDSATILAGRR